MRFRGGFVTSLLFHVAGDGRQLREGVEGRFLAGRGRWRGLELLGVRAAGSRAEVGREVLGGPGGRRDHLSLSWEGSEWGYWE